MHLRESTLRKGGSYETTALSRHSLCRPCSALAQVNRLLTPAGRAPRLQEVLSVEGNCPISWSPMRISPFRGDRPGTPTPRAAQVTARWVRMENPTEEAPARSDGLFPWRSPVWRDFDHSSVSITADGRALPFQLIWDGVSPDAQPQTFDPDQTGTLCTFILTPTQDRGRQHPLPSPPPAGVCGDFLTASTPIPGRGRLRDPGYQWRRPLSWSSV